MADATAGHARSLKAQVMRAIFKVNNESIKNLCQTGLAKWRWQINDRALKTYAESLLRNPVKPDEKGIGLKGNQN